MRRWSETAERVAATSRTSEKVRILAEYLRTLTPAELPTAVTFFTGRPFPERDPRVLGLGWAAIGEAVQAEADAEPGALGRAYDRSSDLGQAVYDLLSESRRRPSGELPTLTDVRDTFATIATASGPAAKGAPLRTLLWRSDPLVAKYLVKVMGGDMRIGLREGNLEAAIAAAFGRPLPAVQWAGMLTGDLGHTAELARDDRLDEAELTLFRPLKSMLASPAADVAEVVARLGTPVWVEDKYDGIRAQLHRQGSETRLYSRDLHDVSGQFPEVIAAAGDLAWSGILDGELLAWRDGTALPFQQLQGRLGRKRPSAAVLAATPVIFVAFDLLASAAGAATPEPLLRTPLRERRERLEGLGLAGDPASACRTGRPPPRRPSSTSASPRPAPGATRGSWSRTPPAAIRPAAAASGGSSSSGRWRRWTASWSAWRWATGSGTACCPTTPSPCATTGRTPRIRWPPSARPTAA